MIRNTFFILFIATFYSLSSFAGFDFEYSRSGSGENFSNNLGLGWSIDTFADPDTEIVGVSHNLYYSFTNANTLATLVSTSPDFQISSNSHDFSYSLGVFEKLTLNLTAGIADYNNKESAAQSASGSLYWQFEKTQIGFGYGTTDYYQVKQVILTLGNIDVTDRMKFRQIMSSFYFDWQISESVLFKLNSAYYKYEIPNTPNITTMDQLSNFTTTGTLLNLAGGSWASEIQSQVAASTDISFLYNYNDNWLIDLSVGSYRDQLSPQSVTNSIGIGFEYSNELVNFGQYRLFGEIEGSKTKDVDQNAFTGSFGLGFSF